MAFRIQISNGEIPPLKNLHRIGKEGLDVFLTKQMRIDSRGTNISQK
jgi:hypothetical protein